MEGDVTVDTGQLTWWMSAVDMVIFVGVHIYRHEDEIIHRHEVAYCVLHST